MPALTRSVSATYIKKAPLTPQISPSANSRALDDMTPLPSLLDKMVEVVKRRTRSTSLQLRSKEPPKLPLIPEGSERPSSVPVKDLDIDQASDALTEVGDEPEPEPMPVSRQSSATSGFMDYEDTPITFSGPVESVPPPAPVPAFAPATPLIHEVVMDPSPPSQPFTHQPHEPPFTLPSAHQEPLLPSELNDPAIFPRQTSYYNPPFTSSNPISRVPLQEQVLLQSPHVNERHQQIQPVVHDITYSQPPIPSPPTHPTTLPFLSASAPVENNTQPTVLSVLAQTLPAFTTNFRPDLQRREPNIFCKPLPRLTLAETRRRPISVPQARQLPQPGSSFIWRYRPCPPVPRWRIRENERQREMDRIAEPYLLRLQEISRQKQAEAEARALAGEQKTDKTKEQRKSWWDFLREDEKKVQKELKEVERQQRSEEKRQTRKDSREKRRRKNADENMQPEDLEQEGSVSPRRKRTSRSKPYSIPHPVTRSPRRLHIMPGGFDSDDLTSDHQTSAARDDHGLWEDFRSAIDEAYRLWA